MVSDREMRAFNNTQSIFELNYRQIVDNIISMLLFGVNAFYNVETSLSDYGT
jgi:hypothetical protein